MLDKNLIEETRKLFASAKPYLTKSHLEDYGPTIYALMNLEKQGIEDYSDASHVKSILDRIGELAIEAAEKGDNRAITGLYDDGYDFGRCFALIIGKGNKHIYDHFIDLGIEDGPVKDPGFATRLGMLTYFINDRNPEFTAARTEFFHKFLQSGADATATGTNKPLYWAATNGKSDIALALLEAGASLSIDVINRVRRHAYSLREADQPYEKILETINLIKDYLPISDKEEVQEKILSLRKTLERFGTSPEYGSIRNSIQEMISDLEDMKNKVLMCIEVAEKSSDDETYENYTSPKF